MLSYAVARERHLSVDYPAMIDLQKNANSHTKAAVFILCALAISGCDLGSNCGSPLCLQPGERNRFYCLVDHSTSMLDLEPPVAAVYLSKSSVDSYYLEGMPDMLEFYQEQGEIIAIGGFDKYTIETLMRLVELMEDSERKFNEIRLLIYSPQRSRTLESKLEALGAHVSYHDIESIDCGSSEREIPQ